MMRTRFTFGAAARNKGLAQVRSSVSVSASRTAARFSGTFRAGAADGSPRAGRARAFLLALGLAVSGCSALNSAASSVGNVVIGGGPAPGSPGYVSGFLGGVAADEPRAALVAREVLSAGGSAADAAVAAGFMLSVTLPSRAGLGGGGACMAYDPAKSSVNGGVPEAVLFVSPPGGGSGARPAAVPMLARGLYALFARYGGKRPFESLTIYAEQAARFGMPVSRAFARDLSVVAGPLAGDPLARAVFFQADGQPLGEGMQLLQSDLGATLAQLRVAGVGDLHVGVLARKIVEAAGTAGGGLTLASLRDALPGYAPAITVDAPGGDKAAFLPPPADGGLAAAAAFRVLQGPSGSLQAAQDRALAVAAAWRAQAGGQPADPAALLAASVPAASLPPLPASTSLVTLDRDGRAVACAFTMNNLFGTGRIAPGTGVLLAASPDWMPPPLLAAGIVWNPNLHEFHAAAAASGQEGAPLAAADALEQSLHITMNVVGGGLAGQNTTSNIRQGVVMSSTAPLRPVPEPGRANLVGCPGYLPGAEASCGWYTDPRGAGLAAGSN